MRQTGDSCPSSRWNAMCRPCCEYQLIQCRCPSKGLKVGYTVPCCRNALHQCDPCIIHPGTHSVPTLNLHKTHSNMFGFLSAFLFLCFFFFPSWGCSLFENCKTCHNGTWKANDEFFINGKYCTDCRQGWSGGDCKSELRWWITHGCCQLCLTKLAQLHLFPITAVESMAQTTNLPDGPHFSLSCSHKHLGQPLVVI